MQRGTSTRSVRAARVWSGLLLEKDASARVCKIDVQWCSSFGYTYTMKIHAYLSVLVPWILISVAFAHFFLLFVVI